MGFPRQFDAGHGATALDLRIIKGEIRNRVDFGDGGVKRATFEIIPGVERARHHAQMRAQIVKVECFAGFARQIDPQGHQFEQPQPVARFERHDGAALDDRPLRGVLEHGTQDAREPEHHGSLVVLAPVDIFQQRRGYGALNQRNLLVWPLAIPLDAVIVGFAGLDRAFDLDQRCLQLGNDIGDLRLAQMHNVLEFGQPEFMGCRSRQAGAGRLDEKVEQLAGAQRQSALSGAEPHVDGRPGGDEVFGTGGAVGLNC